MTPREGSRGAIGEYSRFVAWVVAATAALIALGYLPLRARSDATGVVAMLVALGACAAGSIVGGLPVLVAHRKGSAGPNAVIASMLLRLLVVVVLAALVMLLTELPSQPFLLSLVVGYIVLLVPDTRYAMTLLRSL